MPDRPEVLFVCVHNAGRSQMAAALLAHYAGDRVVVRSAGTAPADTINPTVVTAMREIGIDLNASQRHAQAPHRRSRRGLRRRRHDGMWRRLPVLPRQALRRLEARRPRRTTTRRRTHHPRRDRQPSASTPRPTAPLATSRHSSSDDGHPKRRLLPLRSVSVNSRISHGLSSSDVTANARLVKRSCHSSTLLTMR